MSLRSMTGFSRVQGEIGLGLLTVEMRSVNHRYLDLSLRLPRELSSLEEEIKMLIREKVARGRVEVALKLQLLSNAEPGLLINDELLRRYKDKLCALANELDLDAGQQISLSYLLSLPGVMAEPDSLTDMQPVHLRVKELVAHGLDALLEARAQEGMRLSADIAERIVALTGMVENIRTLTLPSVDLYRQRLLESLKRLQQDVSVDQHRIELEVALWADRANVTEELVRLQAHLQHFRGLIGQVAVGRKMDFYLQELNREANTIGSKAAHVGISQIVVDLKSELEKIREQVQNLE